VRPGKRDTVFVGLGAAVSGLGGFGFTWAVARGTGVEGTGAVLTLTTWFTLLVGITKLGMDTTLVREGGRIRAGAAATGARPLLRWTLLPALVLSAVVGLGIAVASPELADLILPGSPDDLPLLITLGAVALPAGVGTIVALALLRGLGSIRPFVLIEQVGKPGGRTVAALVVAAVGVGAAPVFFGAWLVPVWLGALYTILALRHRLRHEPRARLPREERSRVWRYSAARAVAQVVDLVNSSAGTIVLGAFAGAAAAGGYAAAFRVILAGQLVFQAARLLLAPSLAALLAADRTDDADEIFSTGTTLLVLGAWPLFLVCLVLPQPVLSLFGPGFGGAALTLQILALSGLMLAVVGNQGSLVLMSGRSTYALVATAAGLLVNLGVTLLLLRELGAAAAATGWTLGLLVEGVVLGLGLRAIGVTPLPRAALRTALLTAATVGVGLVGFRLLLPDHPVWAWAVLGVAVLAWLALCLRRGLRAFALLTHQKDVKEPVGV
jgi:O-antigen/teichoic acid export membrane protein